MVFVSIEELNDLDIPSILQDIYLLVPWLSFQFGMCLATSFEVLVHKTNLEFPLRYNQLFYMSQEGSIEFLKFWKPLPSTFECNLYQINFVSSLFENYHQSKIFKPRSYHQILDINFSTLYFRFPYDLLPSVTFITMSELYYCTDRQVSQAHHQIFLYY